MTRRRLALSGVIVAVVSAWYLSVQPSAGAGSAALPQQLGNKEFWALSSSLSEPNGYFRSDNLVSNEIWMQHVIPDLVKSTTPGRVYLGVGPEPNFTYISAMKPAMAMLPCCSRSIIAAPCTNAGKVSPRLNAAQSARVDAKVLVS